MNKDAKHFFIWSIKSEFPFIFTNESCCPAKLASAKSSAVAELRTATKIGSAELFKMSNAPLFSLDSFESLTSKIS